MRFLALLPLLGLVFLGSPASAESLKPGDSLSISVMQDPKLDRQVLVDPSGQIAFPLAGHIHAAGMSPQALEQIIKQRLKPNYKDDDLDITVAVSGTTPMEEDLKPKIFVTGEVARPGSYVVRQPTTLMQAIALAGGLGPYAAKGRIMVRRKGGPGENIYRFDYRAYEEGQDIEGNITLRAGDVVLVPERGLFE
jgi:polysaccharide export outer membrane protein